MCLCRGLTGKPADLTLVIVYFFLLQHVNYAPPACSLAYKIIYITQVRDIFFIWRVWIKIYFITLLILLKEIVVTHIHN